MPVSNPNRSWWRAVIRRDPRLDASFVFGVRSTGIYCIPSCPARRPGRKQVVFFSRPADAEREGFRPCRRCWPRRTQRAEQSALVARVCRTIESETHSAVPIGTLASQAGVSVHRLRRIFLRVMGITPRGYADQVRLHRLKQHLHKGENVTTAMYAAGYGSSSRLYERSSGQLGMTPAKYGQGGRGMEIHYAVAGSPSGRFLVGVTTRGVCALYMGESDTQLEATLRREYPEAAVYRTPARASRWVREISRHLAGRQPQLELPLDIQGTAFQRRVWEALRRIPYGETRSYTEVASQLGRPQARRAVARACATNPVSLVIPCHRVIRGDGGLGGYGGGIERKRALLEREKRPSGKAKRVSSGA